MTVQHNQCSDRIALRELWLIPGSSELRILALDVLPLRVTKSTSPRRWPLRLGHDAAQRNHGVPQLQQPIRRGAPRILVESRFFLLMMRLSIGVKKQSESQHHGLFVRLFGALKLFRSKGGSAWFTQLWRLVLWQFLQLLPMNVQHTISVQIGSRWESCSWSLIFWAPNSGSGRPPPRGYQVHFAQAVASTSTRTWRSKREPWSSTTAAAGGTAWSPKDLGGVFWGFHAKSCKVQIWMHRVSEECDFSRWWCVFIAIVFVPQSAAGFGCFCHVWGSLTAQAPDSICFCKLLSCPA